MLDEQQKRLIASLRTDPAFKALLSYLDGQVTDMLGALSEAESPSDVLRLTRLWQVAVKLVGRLRSAPEEMDKAINEELGRNPLESNSWGIEEDDPFTFHSRPVPPPYQTAFDDPTAKINTGYPAPFPEL